MKYEPIFKLPYSNVFITDMFLGVYSNLYPIATIKNGKWEFFLSKETLKECAEKGFEFALSGRKYKEIEAKYNLFKEKLASLEKIKIKELDKNEFLEFLDEFRKFFIELFKVYSETEFFYFVEIENKLKDFIKDKYSFEDIFSDKVNIASWPEEIRKLADYIINIQHLKLDYRKIINNLSLGETSLLQIVLKELGKRTEREDSLSMTFEEVKDCLNGKEVKNVSDRHVYSYITWDGKLKILAGAEAYRKIREFDKQIPKNEVIGTVACSGFAKGKVKIIPLSMNPEQYLSKMEKGDILISDTTGPDLMPAIEKAAAIVTDEGGMMSHAAIISREFNIPCVVGTKYATEVFKDGDMIEVNANNGVVRKI